MTLFLAVLWFLMGFFLLAYLQFSSFYLCFSVYSSCHPSTSLFSQSPVLPLFLMATLLSTSSTAPHPVPYILSFSSHLPTVTCLSGRLPLVTACFASHGLIQLDEDTVMWAELWCSSLPEAVIQRLWANDGRQHRAKHCGSSISFRAEWDSGG